MVPQKVDSAPHNGANAVAGHEVPWQEMRCVEDVGDHLQQRVQ